MKKSIYTEVMRQAMGERIANLRMQQGWTQEQLAEMAGITQANLRNVEAGRYNVGIDVLNAIADALDAELCLVECPQVVV